MKQAAVLPPMPERPTPGPGTASKRGAEVRSLIEIEECEPDAKTLAAKLGFSGPPDASLGGYYIVGNCRVPLDVELTVEAMTRALPELSEAAIQKGLANVHRIAGITVRDAELYLRKIRHELHQAVVNDMPIPKAIAVVEHLGLSEGDDAEEALQLVEGWLTECRKADESSVRA